MWITPGDELQGRPYRSVTGAGEAASAPIVLARFHAVSTGRQPKTVPRRSSWHPPAHPADHPDWHTAAPTGATHTRVVSGPTVAQRQRTAMPRPATIRPKPTAKFQDPRLSITGTLVPAT